jgi:O-antigen/teichoic acid export membrane protein
LSDKSVYILYAERFINIALGLVSSIILARLLSPSEIGIASLAAATAALCHMVRDMGIGVYISTAEHISEEQRRACLGMAYLLAACGAGVLLLLAYPLSIFYREPRLVYVMALLAFSMSLSPTVAIRSSFLNREKRFIEVSLLNVFNIVIFCVLSIVFALHGASYLSVPLANVAAAILTTALVGYQDGFRTLLQASLVGGKKLLSLSIWPFLVLLTQTASSRSPEFAVARIQGFSASAFFEKSLTAVELARRLITEALFVMLHPRLRDTKEDKDRFQLVCTETVGLFFLIGLFIAMMLSLLARPTIDLLFGEAWAQSGILLQKVAWVSPAALVNFMIIQLLHHIIAPRSVAIWSVATKFVIVAVVVVTAHFGLDTLAWGIVLVETAISILGIVFIRRSLNWTYLLRLILALLPPALIGYVAAQYLFEHLAQQHSKSILIVLCCSFLWLGSTLLLLLILRPKVLLELKQSYLPTVDKNV